MAAAPQFLNWVRLGDTEKIARVISKIRKWEQYRDTEEEKSWALHVSVECKKGTITSLLLQYMHPVDVRNASLQTPLHLAAFNDSESIAEELLNFNASLVTRDRRGFTPLHTCAYWNSSKVCKILCSAGGLHLIGLKDDGKSANGPVTARELAKAKSHHGVVRIIDSYVSQHARPAPPANYWPQHSSPVNVVAAHGCSASPIRPHAPVFTKPKATATAPRRPDTGTGTDTDLTAPLPRRPTLPPPRSQRSGHHGANLGNHVHSRGDTSLQPPSGCENQHQSHKQLDSRLLTETEELPSYDESEAIFNATSPGAHIL